MQRKDSNFTDSLINWYSIVKRDLPWRTTKSPYNVWLSEIILQQTRVDQGLPYYQNFVEHFPTVQSLAAADEKEVLKLWEGLGYYSRARNLHATARHVTNNLGGKFPQSYEGLIKLKGIGPYTAAAIASICFDEAVPVVDGNVFRFISRYFGVEKNISEQKNRKYFEGILDELIPTDDPGGFNQAVMEYGATVCKPAPACDSCIFVQSCYAYAYDKQDKLPVKLGKTKVKQLYLAYLIFDTGSETLMRPRKKSIWTGLYEFHNLESESPIVEKEIRELVGSYGDYEILDVSPEIKHLLSHRRLLVTFYRIKISEAMLGKLAKDFGMHKFSWEEVLTLPRPQVIVNYLRQGLF